MTGHVTFLTCCLCFQTFSIFFLFFSQTAGSSAPPRRRPSPRRRPASVSGRGAPGGRLSPGPVQPERDGPGGGGRPALGEGRLGQAGGVPLPRRLPSDLRLDRLAHPGPRVPVGSGSVPGQRGSVPPVLLQLLEPLWDRRDHLAVPAPQPRKRLKDVERHQRPREDLSPKQEPEDPHVPHLPLTCPPGRCPPLTGPPGATRTCVFFHTLLPIEEGLSC